MDKTTLRTEEKIEVLFNSLLVNKKVASIEIQPKTGIPKEMTVLTVALRILYQNCFYWVDPVKIVIEFESKNLRVYKSYPNQKVDRRSGWLLPHVRHDGTVCLGNTSRDVFIALENKDWSMAVEFIISLLESCAPSGVYVNTLKDVAIRVERA